MDCACFSSCSNGELQQGVLCAIQGISNEVEPYFGVNKFQLGRLLRARLQQRLRSQAGAMVVKVFCGVPAVLQALTVGQLSLCQLLPLHHSCSRLPSCTLPLHQNSHELSVSSAMHAGSGKAAKDQPPATEQQAPPSKATPPEVAEDPHAGFTVAVGNGLFWLLPYVMYWASSTTLHSGMFDNGRLDYDHARCAVDSPLPARS